MKTGQNQEPQTKQPIMWPFSCQRKGTESGLKICFKLFATNAFSEEVFQVEGQGLRITSKSNGDPTLQVVPNKILSAQKNISLFKKPQQWWPLRLLHLAAGGSFFSFLLTWQRRITTMSGDPITLVRLGQDSCPVLHWQHLSTMCHVWNASH